MWWMKEDFVLRLACLADQGIVRLRGLHLQPPAFASAVHMNTAKQAAQACLLANSKAVGRLHLSRKLRQHHRSQRKTQPSRIAWSDEEDAQVLVRETAVEPHMRMPFTNPAKDVDVSRQMDAWGVVELGITHVCTADILCCCSSHPIECALALGH